MISLLLYFSAAFGFCYIVGHSRISLPFRALMAQPFLASTKEASELRGPSANSRTVRINGKLRFLIVTLIECPACLGTWVGGLYGLVRPDLFLPPLFSPNLGMGWLRYAFAAFVAGCATAGVNYLLAIYTGLIARDTQPNA